jgi:ribonuclease R
MILANETVAEFAVYTEVPFLYRIHDKPTEEKISDFTDYLKNLGISVRWSANGVHPNDFSALLSRLEDSPLFSLVNKVMLRSMSKAKYYPENTGHFGLASENYCHFTSPIRRYPDLIVHRAIKHLLNGQVGEWVDKYEGIIHEIAKITSECERRADEAERDVDDLFKAKYMKKHIGEEFEGVVSGVTSFGVFVELPSTVEGLIKLETLPAGNYDFDKKSFTLSSRKLSFRLGEAVTIMVAGVDQANRKVEFIFVNKP